jgi:recombination protein RecA
MAKKNKRAIDDVSLKHLEKFGFIRKGATNEVPGWIPTGHFELDFVLRHGTTPDNVDLEELEDYDPSEGLGVPLGRIMELFGGEGSGKSSLAMRIVGSAQKKGYPCAWIDSEQTFAKNLAEINGIDIEELFYSDMVDTKNPDKCVYAEDVLDLIVALIQSGVKIIVLDSLANIVPRERMEKDASENTMGLLARRMSENLPKICNNASKHGALVIFINQVRMDLGVTYGNPETTPGGRTLKFLSSVRVQVKKKGGKDAEVYKEDDIGKPILIGRKSYAKVVKNKLAKPYHENTEIPIYYEPYFPDIEDVMFETGRQLKLISVRKGEYTWKRNDNDDDKIKIDGKKEFINYIKDNPDIRLELGYCLRDKAAADGVILPPEITQWLLDNVKTAKKNTKKDTSSKENN